MSWLTQILDEISEPSGWGYAPGAPPATEPVALAALALAGHGRQEPAERAADWLVKTQSESGSLGINAREASPTWPTAWALLAWKTVGAEAVRAGLPQPYRDVIERAVQSLLRVAGKTIARTSDMGHDTMLIGWPWVEGTHSWLEPTCLAVMALRAHGYREASRTREAVALIIDRLLPDGGCNYGNTKVLGQVLRPHLEPSGLALLALAREKTTDDRVARTAHYVRTAMEGATAASLAYGLMGLCTRESPPAASETWLEAAAGRARGSGAYLPRLSLLALAQLGQRCPLVT